MKKCFFSIVLIVAISLPLIFPSYAQTGNSRNTVDAAGKRQGYWTIVAGMMNLGAPWAPQQIVWEGNYLDNLKQSTWVAYYQSGNLSAEVSYDKGKKSGTVMYFRENGVMISSSEYKEDLPDGVVTIYYPDGKVLMEYHCVAGEIVGNMKTYYANGNLYEDGTWANGWFIGDYTIYNENGTVKRVALPPITQ